MEENTGLVKVEQISVEQEDLIFKPESINIEYEEMEDGYVKVKKDDLDMLHTTANILFSDVSLASGNIRKLLIDLDVIDEFGDYQKPSFGKLTGFAMSIIASKNPKEGKLKYLIDLKPVLERYHQLSKDGY